MFHLSPENRLRSWREFRKRLDNQPLEEAAKSVTEMWQSCPFVPYYLDSNSPESWPTPWELITENYYCDLAKCLAMLYTLYFTEHGRNLDIELRIYVDLDTGYEYNLVLVEQGKYVLNFQDGEVVNIKSINKNLALKKSYDRIALKLEEY